MIDELQRHAETHGAIRVGLIGAGAMGRGIALQVHHTPGMELAWVADLKESAARAASGLAGGARFSTDAAALLDEGGIEVLVEASNTVGNAARYCLAAIGQKVDVVLMNAEVDLALGPLLQAEACKAGVIVTSDAGDQHGVLIRMIDEMRLWGMDIVQAGNIKGFLDRYATARDLAEEAAKRSLDPIQCCAYTDGTKLAIEMACLANGAGLTPFVRGMEGPHANRVEEAMRLFDFDKYGGEGRVDYLLEAEPGGGVYVVGRCDDPVQQRYLRYYKLGDGPYYLHYRPCHLCHLETPFAIAAAVLHRQAIMTPKHGRLADVYAFAKGEWPARTVVEHGIGGDLCYGLIDRTEVADAEGLIPIALLEGEGDARAVLKNDVKVDQPLRWDDFELPDTFLLRRFREQEALAACAS